MRIGTTLVVISAISASILFFDGENRCQPGGIENGFLQWQGGAIIL
jgi:hypothetical protein